MSRSKAEVYFQCQDCIKSHGMIRGAYEGATCPVHGLPLRRAGTLEEIYRSLFKSQPPTP